MDKKLLPNEKIGLAIISAAVWSFFIYVHIGSPSDKFNVFILPLLGKLDLAFFIFPFSMYSFIKGSKFISANESVIESIKGFMLFLFGVVLMLAAIYVRFFLARESGI